MESSHGYIVIYKNLYIISWLSVFSSFPFLAEYRKARVNFSSDSSLRLLRSPHNAAIRCGLVILNSRLSFTVQWMYASYPPVFSNSNKKSSMWMLSRKEKVMLHLFARDRNTDIVSVIAFGFHMKYKAERFALRSRKPLDILRHRIAISFISIVTTLPRVAPDIILGTIFSWIEVAASIFLKRKRLRLLFKGGFYLRAVSIQENTV